MATAVATRADGEPDEEGAARAPQGEGEHVLSLGGRTEPVCGRGGLAARGVDERRVARCENGSEQGQQREDGEQDQPGQRLLAVDELAHQSAPAGRACGAVGVVAVAIDIVVDVGSPLQRTRTRGSRRT